MSKSQVKNCIIAMYNSSIIFELSIDVSYCYTHCQIFLVFNNTCKDNCREKYSLTPVLKKIYLVLSSDRFSVQFYLLVTIKKCFFYIVKSRYLSNLKLDGVKYQ